MYVCFNCFEDPGMIRFIRDSAVSDECSYCSSNGSLPIAAPIYEVADHFMACLYQEYDNAVNQLGWDGSEGGFQGCYWDSFELILDVIGLSFPQENEETLLPQLLGDRIDQLWCEADAYGLNDEQKIRFSWENFCSVTMHERRFFFLDYDPEPGDREVYSPGQVLGKVFEYAQQIGLIEPLPSGTQLYRARWEGCRPHLETPQELGPPPPEMANQSNRMSPAGIPMFYACDEKETALKETSASPGYYAVGRFETLRSATLLDLSNIPPIPSLFQPVSDTSEFRPREVLTFLNHIGRQMSRCIERGDRVHVDYVPTQVVTEFIRTQLLWDNSRIDGIKYWSSVRSGHMSYVLFADQGNICETSEADASTDLWLKLIDTDHIKLEH